MAKNLVKYSNKLNNIPLKGFTKRDLNFFYSVCSQVYEKGTDLVELSFDEIADLSAYGDREHPNRLRADLNDMRDKVLACTFSYETEEEDTKGNLFNTFTILKTKPKMKIRVNKDFQEFFNALAKEFTQFELEQYVQLDGVYSKALYRLLKQWRMQGHTQIYSVEDIKALLGTPNYKPKQLMDKIIKPAIDEIKKKKAYPNLWVDVQRDNHKRGKPITGYIFRFGKEEIPGQVSLDVLEDGKYMPPKKKAPAKKNRFNNFDQRNYDNEHYEEIERLNL